jgi:cell division protein FtsI (penicillin-binding protein 3)/stage V sporulation protein D (sporulation-specific penicillin-binding protein)
MKKNGNIRVTIFLVLILLASSLIVYRLFVLSVIRHSYYARTLEARDDQLSDILARGNIYFSENNSENLLAATNKKFPAAHIIPSEINPDKADEIAGFLSDLLKIDRNSLLEKIRSVSGSLKIIARHIDDNQVKAIKDKGYKGVGISYETNRFYPGEGIAANLIGFLGFDADGKRAGQYGVEGYYDPELSGKTADTSSLTDPVAIFKTITDLFKKNKSNKKEQESFDRPSDVVLTIDKNVQVFIEDKLKSTLEKWKAAQGTIIVEEPKTGRILAMADWPSFNPNSYSASQPGVYLNRSIQEVYEPGSSFKPVTMAAGIDLSKITPLTTYDDAGVVEIDGYPIRNYDGKAHGVNTMTQVLEKSLNTGTMFAEKLIGDDNFLNYVINMGFGQITGVDLPGEVSGDITNLYSGRKINYLTASFGQGIAVTPLQLVNAYSAIANGGKLMRPYVVDKVVKEDGQELATKPEVVSIPISEKTAVKLQTMLVSVVDKGFDKARIPGYDVAGKTGTAQMPDGTGGYSQADFIHNFVGFAPGYDAKFVILIKMDKPRGINFASDSLSPTFKEIAAFLLNYYNIPPTRK